jgi:hypothetical protein
VSNPNESEFLHGLEVEVEAELTIAESSHPEVVADLPVTEWLYDPADAERYQVGLRGLLDAVKAVEDAPRDHP